MSQQHLLINVAVLHFERDTEVRVSKVEYHDAEALDALRASLGSNYSAIRRGDNVEIATSNADLPLPGDTEAVKIGTRGDLVTARLAEWLFEHFLSSSVRCFGHPRRFTIVSTKPSDRYLASSWGSTSLPDGVGLEPAFDLNVRTFFVKGRSRTGVFVKPRVKARLDTPLSELIAAGFEPKGLYVRRACDHQDERLADDGRLAGRVLRVHADGRVDLDDVGDQENQIESSKARLEPRLETLASVISHFDPTKRSVQSCLELIREIIGRKATGDAVYKRINNLVGHLSKQSPLLIDGVEGSIATIDWTQSLTEEHGLFQKPLLIFDDRRRNTTAWNQGGLDRFGPIDKYRFKPKKLNIAVICQQAKQGLTERFLQRLLHGIPEVKAGQTGFLRRFALERPSVEVFAARGSDAASYKAASLKAMEAAADRNERWDLVIIQTDEQMESTIGDANPYLTTKIAFLRHGIAIQHVHVETMQQPLKQQAYSLNNVGLACYAKLGGVPWLLPSDDTISRELIIGLGSHHIKSSRFGASDRYVGVTSVFTGDGRYLLHARTRSVPFDGYAQALLEQVTSLIREVRRDFAWSDDDPIRLIFHVFKPVKDQEAEAISRLMTELNLPHATFAFIHVADHHPYLLFDINQQGTSVQNKGKFAPMRGTYLQLGDNQALLALKGPNELKQAKDGHPTPILINLHRSSTFRDIGYLSNQIFALSCHSWRSFLPAPAPISILYSQLVANNLQSLSTLSNWSDDVLAGMVGRSRWFL